MIKFKSVKFNNYLIFKSGEIPLENQGVVFIRGINHDENDGSNGSGKSSATSAILVPLIPDTKTSMDDLVLDKDMEITTTFQVGSDEYAVTRYQNHSKYKNSLAVIKNGEKDPDAPKKIPLLEKYIKNIIGISAADYNHFIHIPQKAFSILIKGTPSERYKFLSDLFELDVYDKVYEKIDERHQDVIKQLTGLLVLDGQLTQLKENLSSLPDESSLEVSVQEIQEYITTATDQKNDIYSELNNLKSNQSIINQIKVSNVKYDEVSKAAKTATIALISEFDICPINFGDKNAVELEIMKVNKFVSGLTDIIHESENKVKMIKDRERIISQMTLYKSEYEKDYLQSQIKDINEKINQQAINKQNKIKLDTLKANLEKYSNVEIDIAEADAFINELHSYLVLKNSELANLNNLIKKIESMKDMSVCDRCGAILDKEHTKIELKESKDKVEIVKAEIIDLNNQLTEMNELKRQVVIKENIVRDISKIPVCECLSDSDFALLQDDKKLFEKELEKIIQYLTMKTQLDRIPNISIDLDKIEMLIKDSSAKKELLLNYKKLLEQYDAIFSTLPLNYSKYDTSVDYAEEIKNFEDLYKEITDEYIKASVKINEIRSKINSIKETKLKIVEVENKLSVSVHLQKMDKIYKALKKAYDKKGLKLEKIRNILKAAQNVLPVYSNLLFKNLSFVVNTDNDDVNFKVVKKIDNEIKEYDIGKISGGEECRLIISLVCTFNEINNEKKRSNILILDEIDHYMDDVGAAGFYNEILPIIKEKYESVFIISHTSEMRNRIYDKQMIVSRRDGISSIEFKNE